MEKDINDVESMPRGESVAFGVGDEPYGEITSGDKTFDND